MKILGGWKLVWARKVVLETDFDVMRIKWQQRTALVVTIHRLKAFVPCATYILVGVLDSLAPSSEVNTFFHFLIYCTLRNILHWAVICYSQALVL